LTEAECYARCYSAGDDSVRLLGPAPRRPRVRGRARVSGEELRRRFEERLDARAADAA
jgi:hypothetical protein